MNWPQIVLAGATSALVTWVICWCWYRRKLLALKRKLEQELPQKPSSKLVFPPAAPGEEQIHTVESVEELERTLDESSVKWEKARPCLDTSPRPHVVEDNTREGGRH